MGCRLWFISNGPHVLNAFASLAETEDKVKEYQENPHMEYFDHYYIDFEELDHYPDEYALATEMGLIR